MSKLVCELCGSDNIVKGGDLFVCQECGCKYTTEQARKLVKPDGPAAAPTPHPAVSGPKPGTINTAASAAAAAQAAAQAVIAREKQAATQATAAKVATAAKQALSLDHSSDFRPAAIDVSQQGAQGVNNYACRAWQLFLEEYEKLEHPSESRQEELAGRARECLALLDAAAKLDPNAHEQNLLIYQNCLEIIRGAKQTDYYEKKEDGTYSRRSMPLSVKFELPGEKSSLEDKRDYHKQFLEQEFLTANPNVVTAQLQLNQQAEQLNDVLADLKDEKKSKGFFNFKEKREVKDRMEPYKDQLSEVRRQQRALEQQISDYVESKLQVLEATFTRLDF